METESQDRSVSMERAASLEGSEEPHYQDLLPAGLNGAGGLRVTGLPHHPMPAASVKWLLPHPSWSSPGSKRFRKADAHPAGEAALGKGHRKGGAGFK